MSFLGKKVQAINKLIALPLGSIRAEGWLHRMAEPIRKALCY